MMIHTAPEDLRWEMRDGMNEGDDEGKPESKTPAIMEKNQMKPNESLEIRR
jgi:hypothetical protein